MQLFQMQRIDSSINSRFELIFGQNASRWDQRGLKQHQIPCESTIGYKIFSTFQRWSKMHGIPVWIQQIASYHTMRNFTTLQSSQRSNAVPHPSFTSCGKFSNQKYRSKVWLETLSHRTFARRGSLLKMMPQSKDRENRQSRSRFPWSKYFPYCCEVKSFQLFGE